jgi:hypothetical protein
MIRTFVVRLAILLALVSPAANRAAGFDGSLPPGDPPPVLGDDLADSASFTVEPVSNAEFATETNLGDAPAANAKAAAAAKKKREDLQKAVAGAYKPLFFDNSFAYVNSPLYNDWFPGDVLKRNKIGRCVTYDLGGQYRARFHDERNIRNSSPSAFGLTGLDDAFLLHRMRLFANVELGDMIRIYGEGIDAQSNYEDFTPRAIEENRYDMLNCFADVLLLDGCCGKLTGRVGRQELLYGSERLISPLDWANTRRTFQGAKLLWIGDKWNADVFYTKPVAVNPTEFDEDIDAQNFYGTFATYKGKKNHTFDVYWMAFENGLVPNDFHFQTTGGRWLGARDSWLWDLEGGMQFGDNTNGSDHWAMFGTVGLGRKNDDHCWKPALWCYYDYASGGAARGAITGFHHQFPLAHKYLGFMDLFGRSNIESPNVLLTLQPHKKLKVLAWYYYFFLEDRRDTPYNINMTAFNAANAPASRDLGHEIDLIFTYVVNVRSEVLFGYSHFFAGDYYRLTPGVPYRDDANFVYCQYHWNF